MQTDGFPFSCYLLVKHSYILAMQNMAVSIICQNASDWSDLHEYSLHKVFLVT